MGLGKISKGIPIFGSIFDSSDDDAQNALENANQAWGGFNPNDAEYKQTYSAFNPEDYSATQYQEDPTTKGMQMQYLSKLSGLSDSGLSDEDKEAFEQAGRTADASAQAQTNSAIGNAAARGVSGGGLEFAMREMGNQGGADRGRQMASDQAGTAARNRVLYNQAYGNALTGYRNQNNQVGMYNNDLINHFNQMNTQNHNAAQMYNLTEPNRVKQQNYDNMVGYTKGKTGQYNTQAGDDLKQGAQYDQEQKQNADTAMSFMKMFGGGM